MIWEELSIFSGTRNPARTLGVEKAWTTKCTGDNGSSTEPVASGKWCPKDHISHLEKENHRLKPTLGLGMVGISYPFSDNHWTQWSSWVPPIGVTKYLLNTAPCFHWTMVPGSLATVKVMATAYFFCPFPQTTGTSSSSRKGLFPETLYIRICTRIFVVVGDVV